MTTRRDLRLPILAILLVAAAVFYKAGLHWKTAPTPGRELTPSEHLREAETFHQAIADSLALDPRADIAAALIAARDHYRRAASITDSFTAARACFGLGQLYLLGGDTASAIGSWRQTIALRADDFSALRASKAIADAAAATGDTATARAEYGAIVRVFGESDLTQAGKIIVNAARSRLK